MMRWTRQLHVLRSRAITVLIRVVVLMRFSLATAIALMAAVGMITLMPQKQRNIVSLVVKAMMFLTSV